MATFPSSFHFLERGCGLVLILKFAPAPFFWLLVTWAVVLLAGYLRRPRGLAPPNLFNLGFVAIILAGAEAYFVTHEYTATTFSDRFI